MSEPRESDETRAFWSAARRVLERGTVGAFVGVIEAVEALGEEPMRTLSNVLDACGVKGPSGQLMAVELAERLQAIRGGDPAAIEPSSDEGKDASRIAFATLQERSRVCAAQIAQALLATEWRPPIDDPLATLARSRALWNFARFDLENDEALAQIVDRGSLEDWRALYALLAEPGDAAERLRARVERILFAVPTGHPWFWLAALASLGHCADPAREPKVDPGDADL
ncbi:MAG: hypothetical protein HZB39_17515 [Planctomycetes bacterium]|nr:hypothetical protein [Planctomycetota bacterium]